MHDKDLYARILNIEAPWRVAEVELNEQAEEVVVSVEHDGGPLACPQCGQPARRVIVVAPYSVRQITGIRSVISAPASSPPPRGTAIGHRHQAVGQAPVTPLPAAASGWNQGSRTQPVRPWSRSQPIYS